MCRTKTFSAHCSFSTEPLFISIVLLLVSAEPFSSPFLLACPLCLFHRTFFHGLYPYTFFIPIVPFSCTMHRVRVYNTFVTHTAPNMFTCASFYCQKQVTKGKASVETLPAELMADRAVVVVIQEWCLRSRGRLPKWPRSTKQKTGITRNICLVCLNYLALPNYSYFIIIM